VLDADQIEMWREDKRLEAAGHVLAIFPQEAGSINLPSAQSASAKPGASLWQVQAPTLTYWSDEGKAHLSGGVIASSADQSITSHTLDIFLSSAPGDGRSGRAPSAPTRMTASPEAAAGARQLSRVLAQGAVVVRQGDRRGEAEQAEYTAADGKFVLSGGQPTLINASSDTTTGHSLTFFVANDTILIDSQEGSRTLTKHRVEK
jgi:lipopolysaccharide export system protein LptA